MIVTKTVKKLPVVNDPHLHGIFREDDYSLCGLDFTGAKEYPIDSRFDSISCPLCLSILGDMKVEQQAT